MSIVVCTERDYASHLFTDLKVHRHQEYIQISVHKVSLRNQLN